MKTTINKTWQIKKYFGFSFLIFLWFLIVPAPFAAEDRSGVVADNHLDQVTGAAPISGTEHFAQSVSPALFDIVISPDNERAYGVAIDGGIVVYAIDRSGDAPVFTVEAGPITPPDGVSRPRHIAVSRDGRTVYVAERDQISMLNVLPQGINNDSGSSIEAEFSHSHSWSPNEGQDIADIAVTPDGERLVVLLEGVDEPSNSDGIDDLGHVALYDISGDVKKEDQEPALKAFAPLANRVYRLKSMAISPDGNYALIVARGSQGFNISPFGVRPDSDNRTGGVLVFDLNTLRVVSVLRTTLKGENTALIERIIVFKGFAIKHPSILEKQIIADRSETAANISLGISGSVAGAAFSGFLQIEAVVNQQILQQYQEIFRDYGPMVAYANSYPTDMVSGSGAAITNHGDFGLVTFQDTNNVGYLQLSPSTDIRGYHLGNRPNFFFTAASAKIVNALDLSFGINGSFGGGGAVQRRSWFYFQEAAVTSDDSHAYIGMNGGVSTGGNQNVFGVVDLSEIRREIALESGDGTQKGLREFAHMSLHGQFSADDGRPEFSSPRDVATFHPQDTDGDGVSNHIEAFNRFNDYRAVPFGDKTQLASTNVYNISDPSTSAVQNVYPFNHTDIGFFLPHSGLGYRYNYNGHFPFSTNVGSAIAVSAIETIGRLWHNRFLNGTLNRPYFVVTDMSGPGESLIQNEFGEYRHFNVRNGFQANVQYLTKNSDDPFEFVLSNNPAAPVDNSVEGDLGNFDAVNTEELITMFLDEPTVEKVIVDPKVVDIIGSLASNPRIEVHGSTDPDFPFTRRDADAFMKVVFQRADISVEGATVVDRDPTDNTPIHLITIDPDNTAKPQAVKIDITLNGAEFVRITASGVQLYHDQALTQPVASGEELEVTDTNGVFWMDINDPTLSPDALNIVVEILDRDGQQIKQVEYRAGVFSLSLDIGSDTLELVEDSDGDGVPDYADGFNFDRSTGTADRNHNEVPDEEDDISSSTFTPLTISLAGPIDLAKKPVIRFDYDVSIPGSVFTTRIPVGNSQTNFEPFFRAPAIGSIRLWQKQGSEERTFDDFITSGDYLLEDLGFTSGMTSVTLYVEAVKKVARTEINISLDPDGFIGSTSFLASNSVMVATPSTDELDLRIDSNNDGSIDDSDDDIEDIHNDQSKPGKILSVNNTGVPGSENAGFADFSGASSRQFARLEVSLPSDVEFTENATFSISYSGSDPAKITENALGITGLDILNDGGHLRVWTKDGNQSRNKARAPAGDYFAPGIYPISAIPAGGVFYLEAVAPSSDVGDQRIIVQLDPDGRGIAYEDVVRVTIYDQLWEDTFALDAGFRRVDINGQPIPETEPQAEPQKDDSKNNLYVDTYTLTPVFSVTDISIPTLGPDLRLEFRRTMSTEGFIADSANLGTAIGPVGEDMVLGMGWRSCIGMRIVHSHGIYYVYDDNGQSHRYNASGQPIPHSFLETTTERTDLQIIPNRSVLDVIDRIIWTRNFWTEYHFERYNPNPADFGTRPVSGQLFRLAAVTSRNGNALICDYADDRAAYPSRIYESNFEEKALEFLYTTDETFGTRLTEITDPNGNLYRYMYDDDWNLAKVVTPDPGEAPGTGSSGQTAESYTYTIVSNPVVVEQGISMVYIALNTFTNANGNKTQFDYVIKDRNMTEYEDHLTSLQLQTITTAAGTDIEASAEFDQPLINTLGAKTEVTDSRGTLVTYEFVTKLVPSSLQNGTGYSLNGFTIAVMDSLSRKLNVTSGDGMIEEKKWQLDFSNNTFYNLQEVIDCYGNKKRFIYGKHNGFDHSRYNRPLACVVDPADDDNPNGLNLRTRFEYDFVSRKLRKTIRPRFFEENPVDDDFFTRSYQYDERRNVIDESTEYTDASGQKRSRKQTIKPDARGVPGVTVDADGRVSQIIREKAGIGWKDTVITFKEYAVTRTIDKQGLGSFTPFITREIEYDLNGNVIRESVTYDDADNPGSTLTDVTDYVIDAVNNTIEIQRPSVLSADSGFTRPIITQTYDRMRHLIEETDARGTLTVHDYDEKERHTKSTTLIESGEIILTLAYDQADNKTKEIRPGGDETVFVYDELNRLIRKEEKNVYTALDGAPVSDSLDIHFFFGNNAGSDCFTTDSWNATIAVDRRGYPTENTFDAAYRLFRVRRYANPIIAPGTSSLPASGQSDQLEELILDANNNVIEERVHNPDGSGLQVTSFSYDELERLIRKERVLADTTRNIVNRIFYDNSNNVVATVDPEGFVIQTEYNTLSLPSRQVVKVSEVTGGEPVFTDRGLNEFFIDNSMIETNDIVIIIDYDGRRNKIRETQRRIDYDSNDSQALTELMTEYRYDALNRVIKTIENSDETATVRPDERTMRYVYDHNDNKRLTFVRREDYNIPGSFIEIETEHEYDRLNRRTKTILPSVADGENNGLMTRGEMLRTFDRNSNLLTEIDPRGKITQYRYDGINRVIQKIENLDGNVDIIGPDDVVVAYKYDNNSNVVETSERRFLDIGTRDVSETLANLTEFDAFNRSVRTVDAVNNTIINEYDNVGNVVARTDALGNTYDMIYDRANRLREHISPPVVAFATGTTAEPDTNHRPTMITEYDRRSLVIRRIDANGHITRYEYDGAGRKIGITNAVNDVLINIYDQANNIRAVVDFRGNSMTRKYDRLNRTVLSTDRGGFTVQTFYDLTNNVNKTIDAKGHESTAVYDLRGRVIEQLRRGNTERKTYVHNLNDSPISITDENSLTTTTHYDVLNRPVRIIDHIGNTTIIDYDQADNKVRKRDAEGCVTEYVYDRINRLVEKREELGKNTRYEYDRNSNRTKIVDANEFETTFAYDTINRLTKHTYPTDDFYAYRYDRKLNVVETRNPNDDVILKTYDELDREFTRTYTNHAYSYAYDPNSNLLETIHDVTIPGDGTETWTTEYAWDGRDLMNSMICDYPGISSREMTYEYDGNRNIIREITYDNREITLGHNERDLTTGIQTQYRGINTGIWQSISYNPGSDRTTLTAETDSGDLWSPGELEGLYVRPALTIGHHLIVTNTGNTIVVEGDLTSDVVMDDVFFIFSHSATYTYDEADRITSKNYSNHVNHRYSYNDINLLLENAATQTETDSKVLINQYDYNGVYFREFEKEFFTKSGTDELAATADVYNYDELYRVTGVKYDVAAVLTSGVSASHPPTSPGPFESFIDPSRFQTYNLDLLHNRESVSSEIGTELYNNDANGYQKDPLNRINSVTGYFFNETEDLSVFTGRDVNGDPTLNSGASGNNGPLYSVDANQNLNYETGEDLFDDRGGDESIFDVSTDTLIAVYDSIADTIIHGAAIGDGAVGTQTGIYYFDQDQDGYYGAVEDIWKEHASQPGRYDADTDRLLAFYHPAFDQALYDGDVPEDLGAPIDNFNVIAGSPGVIAGLYFYDINKDGVYSIGEDVWVDTTDTSFDAGVDGVPGTEDDVDMLIYSGSNGLQIINGATGTQENLFYGDANGDGSWDEGEDIWVNIDMTRPTANFNASEDTIVYDGDVPEDSTSPTDNFTVPNGVTGSFATLFYHDRNDNNRYDADEDIWFDADDGIFDAGIDGIPGTADDGDVIVYTGTDGLQIDSGTIGAQRSLYYHDSINDGIWNPGEGIWTKPVENGVIGINNFLYYDDADKDDICDADETIWLNQDIRGADGSNKNVFFHDLNANNHWDPSEGIWVDSGIGADVVEYDYDRNGNLTADDRSTYHWTALNELETVDKDNTEIVRYVYDGTGRRCAKILPDGSRTYYYYDGYDVILEVNETNTPTIKYLPGIQIDQPIVAEINDDPLYFHQNVIGNVAVITDKRGDPIERYDYDIYGNVQVLTTAGAIVGGISTTATRSPYLFTGRRYDPETQLYFFRHRYYSANLGRFISHDPLDYVDGMNVYAYVNGNTVNLIDPMGLESVWDTISGYASSAWNSVSDYASLFTLDNISRAWNSDNFWYNIETGGWAALNGVVDTVLGVVTLGMADPVNWGGVQDRVGYKEAYGQARIGGELAFGLYTGSISAMSKIGKGVMMFDVAGNFVSAGRGVADMVVNGFSYSNGIQVAAGLFGLGGNYAGLKRASKNASAPKIKPKPKSDPPTAPKLAGDSGRQNMRLHARADDDNINVEQLMNSGFFERSTNEKLLGQLKQTLERQGHEFRDVVVFKGSSEKWSLGAAVTHENELVIFEEQFSKGWRRASDVHLSGPSLIAHEAAHPAGKLWNFQPKPGTAGHWLREAEASTLASKTKGLTETEKLELLNDARHTLKRAKKSWSTGGSGIDLPDDKFSDLFRWVEDQF